MDLIISNTHDNKKGVYILNNKDSGYYQLASNINYAFGNLIDVLKESFPEIANMSEEEHAAYTVIRIINNVKNKKKKVKKTLKLYGLTVSEDEAFNIISLTRQTHIKLTGKSYLIPIVDMTIQDVETWYLKKCYRPNRILPLESVHTNGIDFSKGLRILDIKSLFDVVYGLLYFYAFNKLKQTECTHCGRWFATNSLKNEYCNRKSPCNYNDIFNLSKREPLKCKDTVKYIRQKCTKVRGRIREKSSAATSVNSYIFIESFEKINNELFENQKEYPTVKNLTEYYTFLANTEKNREWTQGRANNG